MSCDEVRQALPLLPGGHEEGGDGAVEARARAHLAGCAACAAEAAAFEADAAALAAVRAVGAAREVPPILAGFSADVMARIATEEAPRGRIVPFAAARQAAPVRATGPARAAAAMAAAFLLTAGLAWTLRSGPDAGAGLVTASAPEATGPEAPARRGGPVVVGLPAAGGGAQGEALPAPARRDAVPMPARLRGRHGPIVPVGEGGAATGPRGVRGRDDLLDLIERVLPGMPGMPRDLRRPGEPEAREVRF